ncbi:MAG: N-formylglutamate amidohydrolase [Campylobacterales bacterium]|nr:N-formylglutamate amidohydrolase [Campylobacterales bacterium]
MLEDLIKAIKSIEVIQGKEREDLKEKDEEAFQGFRDSVDFENVVFSDISSFQQVLKVFNRPLHFENLFWYSESIGFLLNPLHLNTLLDCNLKRKYQLQQELKKLYKKLKDVYRARLETEGGSVYDEHGFVNTGLGKLRVGIDNMINKVVVHIPHSGLVIPDEFRGDYLLDDEELERNIYQYADYKADKFFGGLTSRYDSVISPYSRLFFDPERFFDDDLEPMEKNHGLGWFYHNGILDKKPLRSKDNKEKIAKYYHQHHKKLTDLVEEKLKIFGECIIIDCHTFSNERYWFMDKNSPLPDVCIGFEKFHKDEKLIKEIEKVFLGKEILMNSPYSGSMVPSKFYQKDKRVKSVMIEVNKKLYLQEDNVTVKNRFVPYGSQIGGMNFL